MAIFVSSIPNTDMASVIFRRHLSLKMINLFYLNPLKQSKNIQNPKDVQSAIIHTAKSTMFQFSKKSKKTF